MLVVVLLALGGVTGELRAQNLISVPFTDGFIGTRGSSAGTANGVLTYATLGIARTFFIQSSSTNTFELQGNDIPGTLRIVRTDGTTLDIPASANWRNSGGTTYLIGMLPRPASPITLTYAGGSVQITDGTVPNGSSVGGYVAAYGGAVLADGASTSGNAAQSQVLGGLNSYLSTVVVSRPAGPVTVTALSTTSTTPTITGTATLSAGEQLSVVVDDVEYTTASTPALALSGTDWSLALATPLAVGPYSVTATVTNLDGFTLSDPTDGELVIRSPGGTLTLAGSFTASDRGYDGTLTATGTTGGLTLVGVTAPDEVTIAAVTLAFQDAGVGSAKPVVITGVTLGGAEAARYDVSLVGAPTATASITARPLTVGGSFTVADRTFDGTTTATIATSALTVVGVVGSDDVALTGVTAAFADADVGADKPVTLSGASLTGAAAANYALGLAGAPTTTASILAVVPPPADSTVAPPPDSTVAPPPDSTIVPPPDSTTVPPPDPPADSTDLPPADPPADPPAAPRDVAATAGDGRLTVTWAPPTVVGCGAVTGYVVESSANAGATWVRAATAPATPTALTLPGLVNTLAYLVRVAAVNACGTGAFSAAAGPVVPVAPTRDGQGQPVASDPGTAYTVTDGEPQPVTIEVVQDTLVRLAGAGVTLRLHASDQPGAPIPIDSSRTLQLEQGGRATADGSGFAPGSFATTYLFTANGQPLLLGLTTVEPDGSFTATFPIPDSLAAGDYTLQVNGVDPASASRSLGVGVELWPPPADLALAATPDVASPMVGDTITITLTVTNTGRGPATDVVIPRAFHEPGFTVIQAAPQEGTYDAATHEWTIARIEPGARARLLLTVVVVPPADAGASRP
jgi:hypothetical protein